MNRLKIAEEIDVWLLDLRRKGEAVVMSRGLEMKEVDGEEAARRAARRMRCLQF